MTFLSGGPSSLRFGIKNAFLFHELNSRISKKGDLTMYRKMFTGMICLMLLGIFFVPKGRSDLSDKKTIVTVDYSIQVPGKVLPAGTYVFRLLSSNDPTRVSIFNADET